MAVVFLARSLPTKTPNLRPPVPTHRLPHARISASPISSLPFLRLSILCSSAPENGPGTTESLAKGDEKDTEAEEKEDDAGEAASTVAELKQMMAARREKENFLGGVGEEVRAIEWPAFRKVLGTTGVVLAVITGSSVALLTVNAVLSELSDRLFAGRGLQDFFG